MKKWEYVLLLFCFIIYCTGCAVILRDKNFAHADKIVSNVYGEIDNITINHEGNLMIW